MMTACIYLNYISILFYLKKSNIRYKEKLLYKVTISDCVMNRFNFSKYFYLIVYHKHLRNQSVIGESMRINEKIDRCAAQSAVKLFKIFSLKLF